MRLSVLSVVAIWGTLQFIESADAVWFEDTYHNIKRGYHRNEAWPFPFFCPDRASVREPFRIMVDNGWRRQNLLGEHHFNAETNRLTTAGELRAEHHSAGVVQRGDAKEVPGHAVGRTGRVFAAASHERDVA